MIFLLGTVVGLLMFVALAGGLTGAYNLWVAYVDFSWSRATLALMGFLLSVVCVAMAVQVIQEAIGG